MKAGFFIVGTDTGVGKTLVAASLLYVLADLGYSTVGMKPIAAGFERCMEPCIEGWRNADVEALRAASCVTADLRDCNPYALRAAVAPHIAAEQQGVALRIPPLRAAFERLAAQADCVVVEGVGGVLVPLDAQRDMADVVVALGVPVILVVGMRLGSLNHALLSAEALRRRGVVLAGWVANDLGTGMAEYAANVATLQQRLAVPLLAELPWITASEEPAAVYRQARRYWSLARLAEAVAAQVRHSTPML